MVRPICAPSSISAPNYYQHDHFDLLETAGIYRRIPIGSRQQLPLVALECSQVLYAKTIAGTSAYFIITSSYTLYKSYDLCLIN